jgi:cyanophycinase
MNASRCVDRFALTVFLVVLIAQSGGAGEPVEEEPEKRRGSLVICGGGALPPAVIDRFCELAGGAEARIVVIPTASALADSLTGDQLLARWRERPAQSVSLLHTRNRSQANDSGFAAPLANATGVWMMGGDQSRLADAYLDTLVEQELERVLGRGGVIGGTSAGAAIMSRHMIAGGKTRPHLATGFDLLPGAIIDQHFLRRNRQDRLKAAIAMHETCFGLGIDERAAVVVVGESLEVIGESTATIYPPGPSAGQVPRQLYPGATANLSDLRRPTMLQSAFQSRSR